MIGIRRFLASWLPASLRPRVVVWTREPMTDEQLAVALAEWPEENRQRQAVVQLLQMQLDAARTSIGEEGLTDAQLRHRSGGIEALQELQGRLEELLG